MLTACGPSAEQQATMTATALTATAAAWTSTPTATSTRTPTKTSIPTQTSDPDYYYAPDHSYSLIPPRGWQPQDTDTDYPALIGPNTGSYIPHLLFFQEESAFDVFFYAALVQDATAENVQNLTQISEEYPTTNEGKDYFRWEITCTEQGETYRQIYFFFESGDWKLTIVFTRMNGQGSEYDALIDDAMNTVRFHR